MALEQPVLSILIPFTKNRIEIMKGLIQSINLQIEPHINDVEVLFDNHETDNVGIKRNRLLRQAKGRYVVFIDSDDQIMRGYVSKILDACKSDADCIGINGYMTTNKKNHQEWYISKDYGKWFTANNTHFRTTNHISPVKRELALMAMFPEIPFGEDYQYSMRLLPFLKTEKIIAEPLYYYDYRAK